MVFGPNASPVVAVGGAFIDATPRWLKEFAIREFGTNDKTVLVTGILVVLTVLAAVAGVLSVRRPRIGLGFVAVLALVGALAAVQRPTSSWSDALPSLVGGFAGWAALDYLGAALRRVPTPRPAPLRLPDTAAGEAAEKAAPGTSRAAAYDRRAFVLGGATFAAIAAVGGAAGRRLLAARIDVAASRAAVVLPPPAQQLTPRAAELDVPGISPFLTPVSDFYRIDTAIVAPQVATEGWRLRVHGLVDREIDIDFAQLLARPVIERDVTLACVSNEVGGDLVGNARWRGTPLADLLREAGVHQDADQLLSRSSDGMTIGSPLSALMDGRDAMLAYGMNGAPLTVAHGFPVRLVVPGLYGYVSATKWVVDLEVTRFDKVDAYWIARGWAPYGPIHTMARIDTPRARAALRPGPVAVAGVAWAQHRGIRGVEVRVDGGGWHPARIADETSIDTWRQWVFTWDATAGTHRIEARAIDGKGDVQTAALADPFPAGATGYHSRTVTVS